MGKTLFDSAAYAVGAKDELRGTGVWGFLKLSRGKDDKEKDSASSKGKKGARDTRSNAFVNQEARALYDRRIVPVERLQIQGMRGTRLGSGALLKLSAGKSCESNLVDVSILGLFALAFFMLALTGLKKLRNIQNPLRAMQRPL